MELSEFKKVNNRQRPDFMYKYVHKNDGTKTEIGTLNGSKSFFLSIESLALNGRTYLSDLWEENFKSINEALTRLNNYKNGKNNSRS